METTEQMARVWPIRSKVRKCLHMTTGSARMVGVNHRGSRDRGRVRADELGQLFAEVSGKGQAFGERSRQNLSALVFQKNVEARCHKKDRYVREVCAVYVARRDVGLEQIRIGMAWHYKAYQHEQPKHERLVYRDEEVAAKAAKHGPWKDAKLVPPRAEEETTTGQRPG